MLLSRVCFSIHLWRLLFDPLVDCVFFLDRSWTGNANEQPISPPADGRHVPLGRGRCKHYRNIGRSCAVIIGSRFLDKGQAAGLHQQSNENERFSENLNAKLPFWFLHAVLQSFGRLTELCRQFEQRGFRVKFCGLIREFHTILGLSPI